jgi:hypothetical protein
MNKKMFLGKWLLAVVILMISSPLSIGKGSGGCGMKGCECPLSFISTRVRVIFNEYTASTMPQGYDRCGVPDRESNFPNAGGTNIDTRYGYVLKVVVFLNEPRCKRSYRKVYVVTEPTDIIDIEVPYTYKYTVDVYFFEKCNSCISGDPNKMNSKFYRSLNEFSYGAPSIIYAQMEYRGFTRTTHNCQL